MRAPRRRRRRQAGFTLIELMISLVLFSFAVAGVLAVAVSMVNGFREQRLAVATEGAARAAMNYMADALRGASPAVPSGQIVDTTTCDEGALIVTSILDAPDELEAVFASGSVVTATATLFDQSSTAVTFVETDQLAQGDTVLITNFGVGHLVTLGAPSGLNSFTVSPATCGGTITFPTAGYPAGSVAVRAMRARFYISSPDGIPTLFMDPDGTAGTAPPEPLAEGIEDMQIAIAIDQTDDGITELGAAANDDEWIYNVKGDDVPALPIPTAGTIRALRITLVARATNKVTGAGAFLRPALEDSVGSTVPDEYRRRVLTSVIEIRNLGGSP